MLRASIRCISSCKILSSMCCLVFNLGRKQVRDLGLDMNLSSQRGNYHADDGQAACLEGNYRIKRVETL